MIAERRLRWRIGWRWLSLPLAVLGAFVVCGLIILLLGVNPFRAIAAIVVGGFGTARALVESVLMATPLALIGLGLVLAFRCKVWNIGAEGQYLMGAAASTWVGLTWGDRLPSFVVLTLMLLAGGLAGAAWAAIAGILKAKRGLSDVVLTLMLNYVAVFGFSYLVRVPMRTASMSLPQTDLLPEAARLPMLFGTRIHAGVIIAFVAAGLVHLLLWHTTLGYELRAVGSGDQAAAAAGIRPQRSIILAMTLSGFLSGVAGMVHISGVDYFLHYGTAAGFGNTAILIAVLGQLRAGGVLAAAFFFAGLVVGVDSMHRVVNLPQALVSVVQATVVLFFLIGMAVRRRRS